MNFLDKFKAWFYGAATKVTPALAPPAEPVHVCGKSDLFADPENFDDYSDHDSLLVDSKEGAPE